MRYDNGRAWRQDWAQEGSQGRPEGDSEAWAEGSSGSGSWPAARHAARLQRRARQGWRQFGFRRQFVTILVMAACLSAVGTVALAALWLPPIRPEAGVLLVIGLALTTLCLFAGYLLSRPVSRRAYDALTGGLDEIARAAVRLDTLSMAQTTRTRQQELLGRQLSDEVRALGEAAERLERGIGTLRDLAGEIWAEMSYPPSAVDTPITARSARRAAVTASELGAAIEQTATLCYRLRARTNLVIAEADLLGTQGRETERMLGGLRAGVVRVEEALGRDLAPGIAMGRGAPTPSLRLNSVALGAMRLDSAETQAILERADTQARSAWSFLRALMDEALAWGRRRLGYQSEAFDGADYMGQSGSAGGAATARPGAMRAPAGRSPSIGWWARPNGTATRGHIPSHPHLPGSPARPRESDRRAPSSGRHMRPSPHATRPTPPLAGDGWLNGGWDAR